MRPERLIVLERRRMGRQGSRLAKTLDFHRFSARSNSPWLSRFSLVGDVQPDHEAALAAARKIAEAMMTEDISSLFLSLQLL